MKWSEMPDKEKVRLLLTHVVPHEIADDIVIEQNTVVVKRRWTPLHPVEPVRWPVAAWDEGLECWQVREMGSNNSVVFDPLHDLNTAWKLTELMHIANAKLERHWFGCCDQENRYLCTLMIPDKQLAAAFAATPQEAICLAALAANGVEIEP